MIETQWKQETVFSTINFNFTHIDREAANLNTHDILEKSRRAGIK